MLYIKASVCVNGDHLAASLETVSIDTAVCEIVDRVAVGHCDALILHNEIIKVIVTVEEALCAAKLYHSIEERGFSFRRENDRILLTGVTLDKLHIFGILTTIVYIFPVCITNLKERNVEEGKTLWHFKLGRDARKIILGNEGKLGSVMRSICINNASIPLNLTFLNVVVIPVKTHRIILCISVCINHDNKLSYNAASVLYNDNVVTYAVNILRTCGEKAVLVLGMIVHCANLFSGLGVIYFGIVVAQCNRPVNAEIFHQADKVVVSILIVESSRIRIGRRHITCGNYKVRLLCRDHCRNSIDSLLVVTSGEATAANVRVGYLHDLEIAVCSENEVTVSINCRFKLTFILNPRECVNVLIHANLGNLVSDGQANAKNKNNRNEANYKT